MSSSLRVWVTTLILIAGIIYLWPVLVDTDDRVGAILDEHIGDNLPEGSAPHRVYQNIRSSGTQMIMIIGPLALAVYLIWAFLSMQRRERLSGIYGGRGY